MNKITGIIRLIRPINCIIMGFAVLVGAIVTNRSLSFDNITLTHMAFGFITGFTFLAAANTVNDYYDRKIDAVNEPNRPIPSGVVKPNEALGYATVLSATGFIAAFLTNIPSLIASAVIAWFMFMYYATKGKRTGIPGNIIVSACIAIPFIYGSLIAKGETDKALTPIVIAFAGMAFFSTVGREITKGIVDVKGDKLEGVGTVAVLYGSRKAAFSAVIFYLFAVFLSSFLLLEEVSVWYLPFVAVADLGFIFSSASLLGNYSRENARRVKNMVRIWMVIGLFAFVAGVLG